MRKAKSLLGRKVLTRAEGRDLGNVKDLLFDGESGRLLAVLLTDRELFGAIDATCVPWKSLVEVGPDAVLVEHDSAVLKVHSDPVFAEAYDAHSRLDGKQVTSERGEKLGHISDLYIDENGYIVGYEISDGVFADAFNGKRFMPVPVSITHGKDVVIVPHGAEIQTPAERGEPGGIKDRVADVSEDLTTASAERQRAFVVGKTASRDVIIGPQNAQNATPENRLVTDVENQGASALSGSETDGISTHGLTGTTTHRTVTSEEVVVTDLEPGETIVIRPKDVEGDTVSVGTIDIERSQATMGENATTIQRATPATPTDVNSRGEIVEGEVLVREGEIITESIADRALATGTMPQLVVAAGGSSLNAARDRASDAFGDAQDRAAEAAIGNPAAREVDAPNGEVLVAPGQIVTRDILMRAERVGKKNEVIAAAGLGAASEAAQQAGAQIKETAGDIWDTVRDKVEELTGTAQEKKAEYDEAAREKRIRYSLGRPVTRVVLAQDDTVILNTGDIITHAAVEHARSENVLEILLDSVYDQDPQITPEMMRAEQPGVDALPGQAQPDGSGPHTATVAPETSDSNSGSSS